MKIKFVDKIELRGKRYTAAYFPEIKTIKILRHLSWWGKLDCLLHEIPHVVNHSFLGSSYLDFMWDVLNILISRGFSVIAEQREYYFGRRG